MSFRYPPGSRCGPCIDGDHRGCVVEVEMGSRDHSRTVGSPRWMKASKPYPWNCRCECREWVEEARQPLEAS